MCINDLEMFASRILSHTCTNGEPCILKHAVLEQAEFDECDERQRFERIKVNMLDILTTELSKFVMREDAAKKM